MEQELITLYQHPESGNYLLYNESHGGNELLGVFWGSGEGASRLPLAVAPHTFIHDYYPRPVDPSVEAMQTQHVWTEPISNQEIRLRLLDPDDYHVELSDTMASITRR